MVEEKNEGGEESASQLETGRVKFFCSHGGKILPRPSDGTLKYVGGETRAVAVPRSISFSELMKKINDLFDGEYILKYQIAKEDLDSLVSVKSDEDMRHMLDEYDRLEQAGPSKLRTFLFPVKPFVVENHTTLSGLGLYTVDQRFVDAINGIVRPTNTGRLKSISPSPTEGSPGSLSPRKNVPQNPPTVVQENNTLISRLTRVHRVQSSPNLCTPSARHFVPATPYPHYYHGCQSPDHHSPNWQGYQSPMTVHGRSEYSRAPLMGHHNAMSSIRYPGSGGHRRWGHLEQYSTPCGSLPRSPGDLWEF
ncbi:hypothetical protein KSS87_013930 [Heliosperma pusillum]|nr:hypothetical protein KSS87_018879 [Heliosperma pusillum]KAH9626293.1 hypothetical protein KSS87_013930 [Heliosperma pusillum]